jgi:ABC-type amino acid transport system permease subunit
VSPETVRDAATALVALDGGFLGVVITLVALLPALTEAALKGTTSEYERAVRGSTIQHDLLWLRLQIPLLTLSVVSCGVVWVLRNFPALIVAVVLTLGALLWLSYVAYVISRSLGRFLIQHESD